MSAGEAVTIEPFLYVEGKAGAPELIVARVEGGGDKWVLAERKADGRLHIVSPFVDVEMGLRGAAAVLAGETAALTHPKTKIILALALAAMAATARIADKTPTVPA